MKKLLLVAFLFCGYANAQTVEFGAKAGVNFASVGGDDTEGYDGRTGFHLGLVAEFPLTENFAFQPEVLYSSQGAKAEESDSYMGFTYSSKATLKLDYINVPLMAKYTVTPGFSIQAGPQLGFLINSEGDYEITMDGETESGTEDLKDDTKGFDFAVAAGLGYQLDMGIFFNARYNIGLSNIWDVEGEEDYSQQNNVLQLSVGYMF
ncbi:porin family protein [Salinimicrobium gaetbulicola]|uniref:Porin family protein n=1 Tax=Salinimicrobium gaetbulicola TaxID=999702 RepID=A0ABW3IAZ8_9FLAO